VFYVGISFLFYLSHAASLVHKKNFPFFNFLFTELIAAFTSPDVLCSETYDAAEGSARLGSECEGDLLPDLEDAMAELSVAATAASPSPAAEAKAKERPARTGKQSVLWAESAGC